MSTTSTTEQLETALAAIQPGQTITTLNPDGHLAWSLERPPKRRAQPARHRSWGSAWARAAMISGFGVLVAAGVWVGWQPTSAPAPRPAPPPTTAVVTPSVVTITPPTTAQPGSSPAAVPPAAPAPEIDPLTPTDRRYLAQLDQDVPGRNPGTEGSAVFTGHAICRALQGGQSEESLTAMMSQQYLTWDQARAYILDAVMFYCPHAIS